MSKTWDKIKDTISGVAPLIGSLVGGPAGNVVGQLVSSALGVENTPDAIDLALTTDPDALVKLKELEFKHKTRFEEIALEETRIHQADRQGARQAEIDRMKSGGSNKFMYYLAGMVVFGFFAVITALFLKAIPEGTRDVAYLLLGTLAAEFGSVMRYFFGSSKGSSDKTAMLMKGR